MTLPTVQDAKDYLRLDSTSDDALVGSLLTGSIASIEGWLGYPITAVVTNYTDFTDYAAHLDRRFSASEIQLPGPFALTPAPVVTDGSGVVVDPTTYLLDPRAGKIRAKFGTGYGYDLGFGWIFDVFPYTVGATIGLSAHPDYSARLESIVSVAILDLVTHRYENRNPMLADDQGAGITPMTPAIPQRIVSDLLSLPCTRGFLLV